MKLLYVHLFSATNKQANVVQVFHMCQAFQQIGVEVTLALPENKSGVGNKEIIKNKFGIEAKFKIKTYPKYTVKERPMSLGSYWGVKSILNGNKDIDYCFVRDAFIAEMAVNRDFKTIYEQHDARMHPIEILNRLYFKKYLKNVRSKNLVKIVAISHALADILIKRGVPRQKILVLHDGVAADDFSEVKSQAQARAELGITTNKNIVMYVGSLYEDRGIGNILRLARSFPQCEFFVVGGPEQRKFFWESKVKKEGLSNLTFIGRVPHSRVKTYLFAADVLLMLWSKTVPTINICSPLKVFEYMASGRIIVGHGFPTIKEIIKDGEVALLTDPESYDELESTLGYALTLGYPNEMATKARNLVLSNYSWEKRTKSIIEAITSQ